MLKFQALSVDEEAHIPTSMVDSDMLKHFAEEAEVKTLELCL